MEYQYINIKDFGWFISQGGKKFKTTLCKLYHITHILEAVGIIRKTDKPGESYLCDEFFISASASIDDELTPISICNLLNRHNSKVISKAIRKRRNEYIAELERMNSEDFSL